uniref:K+ potassium transporter integral membrane domain-containing protein n=1 Tax=Cucumis melo TaxID=3656 RepID=A0A9I9E569_CUCME
MNNNSDDDDEGGTFALYSLLCRYAKIGLIPSQQAEKIKRYQIFNYIFPPIVLKWPLLLNLNSKTTAPAKMFLLFATMLGTSMVIGDGVLSPSSPFCRLLEESRMLPRV